MGRTPVIRIICGDPAEKGDYFAVVGVDLDIDRGWIFPKYARQWQGLTFPEVARRLKPLIRKIKPKFWGLETNYKGSEVIEAFTAAGIPAQGISSVGLLTSQHRKYWQSMDSSYTVQWMKEMKFSQSFRWPAKPTAHMKLLENQISDIEETRTPSGNFKYAGRRGRHDDLFAAFKLCCHVSRIYMEREDAA